MKKYIAIFAVSLLALVSCEKQFEVKDSSRLSGTEAIAIAEEDPGFLSSYVNGFYSWMVQFNTGGGSHQDFGHLGCVYTLDMYGQDIAICGTWNWGRYDINHDYGAYNWVRPYQFWNFYYTLLKKCNEVIDFFGEEDPSDATLRGYLGQAYALRAFCYTYLIQIFQDPVTGTTPNAVLRTDAKAVPIVYSSRDGKTVEESDEMSGRNTYADLMEEIERNIALSLPLLEGYVRGSKNEVNYSVAQGIAARYYLLTQQWAEAASAAAAAQTGFDIMDRTRLMSGFMDVEDKEVMWGFNHTTETQTAYASYFSHMSNDCAGYGGVGQSVHCIDRSLYDQIPDTDYRKELFNGPNGDPSAAQAGGKLPYAARKFGYMASWLQDYTYMRNSEMILIQAEAEARQGQNSAAAQTLGKLMAKRNPAWASANVTVDDVLLQRRIELWGEGFEYFDLRRNGLGVNRKYEGSNHLASGQYAFPAHGKSWNFQIPRQELQNNTHITDEDQNEWITGTEE
jgi:SusD family.